MQRERASCTPFDAVAVSLLLLLSSAGCVSSEAGFVKVASGWACGDSFLINALGSGATLASCTTACTGNCSAVTFREEGSCWSYSACPVLGRHLMPRVGANFTGTYHRLLSPELEDNVERSYSGMSEDYRVVAYSPTYQRPSWTVVVAVRPVASSHQAVLSTENDDAGYGLWLHDSSWELHIANGSHTFALKGARARLHTWASVVLSFAAETGEMTLEVDGVVQARAEGGFAQSHVDLSIGHSVVQDAPFRGSVRALQVYSATLDSHTLLALREAPMDQACLRVSLPNVALATGSNDHGAAHSGMCLYLAEGDEVCSDACRRLTGGGCDAAMETLASTWLSCAAAMQRLGVPYTSVTPIGAEDASGCVWGSHGHALHSGPGATCDSEPPPGGNETRYRVCACHAEETATVTAVSCGNSGEVCTPCPHLLFTERRWLVTSDTAACAQNANGTGSLLDTFSVNSEIGAGLDTCRSRCEGTPLCEGIDYYAWTGLCALHATPCTHPLAVGNGSSSHRLDTPVRRYTCPEAGLVAAVDMALTASSLCACRDVCAGVKGAVYGTHHVNTTTSRCSCFATCSEAVEVSDRDCGANGCSNVTSFYIDVPETSPGDCATIGVQKLNIAPFVSYHEDNTTGTPEPALGGAGGSGDLGTPVFGGAEGFTFGGWFRREGRGSVAPNNVWRITNLDDVTFGWHVCEVAFYYDDACSEDVYQNGSVTWEVHGFPFRAHTFGNASLANDNDDSTCAAVSCGEFASGLGCSPKVASYTFVFSESVELRCVKVFQSNHHTLSTARLGVEKLSNGGTWVHKWDCFWMAQGRHEECSIGTGIVHIPLRTTWEYAREECSERGGDMVALASDGANRAAMYVLWVENVTDTVWIGASREDPSKNTSYVSAERNTFQWVDGTAWRWLTQTVTMSYTNKPARHNVDTHNPLRSIRDYSNWACGGHHPLRFAGGCAFMYGVDHVAACGDGSTAGRGEWGAHPCELSRSGVLCNITTEARPRVSNLTTTQTVSLTAPYTVGLPVSLLHCSAGVSDDLVSLQIDPNATTVTYTVQRSAPSNFPTSSLASADAFSFTVDAVPLDSKYHYITLSHKKSGIVHLAVDFNVLGGRPYDPLPPDSDHPAEYLLSTSAAVWYVAGAANLTNGSSIVEVLHDSANLDTLRNNAESRGEGPTSVPKATPAGQWPAMYFGLNATSTTMQLQQPLYSDTTGVTIFAVIKPTGAAAEPHLLDISSYWGLLAGVDKVSCFAGMRGSRTTLTSFASWNPPGDEGWVLVTCRIAANAQMQLRINGALKESINSVDIPSLNRSSTPYGVRRNETTGPQFIGSQATSLDAEGKHYTGYLAELLIFNEALLPDQIDAMERVLSLKYFGGRFFALPARIPRSECGVGYTTHDATEVLGFAGTVRDVVLLTEGTSLQDTVSYALDAKPLPLGKVARQAACTTPEHCTSRRHARFPVEAVDFVHAIQHDSSIFEGVITVDKLPSGDQPVLTYGGVGCGEGSLSAWVYPAAQGYGVAFGEWDGAAVRSTASLELGRRYRVKFEVDTSVGTPTTVSWYGASLLTSLVTVFGRWHESATKCFDGTSICIVAAEPLSSHTESVLATYSFIPTASSSISVETFGTPGTQNNVLGLATPHASGFAGIALYDTEHKRYVFTKSRLSFGANTTGLEVLSIKPWDFRKLSGRTLQLHLIDAYCMHGISCEQGWLGFGRVAINNVNASSARVRVTVHDNIVASGFIRLLRGPFRAGDVSLMAHCHNDTNSGSLHGSVDLTLGCPIYNTKSSIPDWNPVLRDNNASSLRGTPTPTFSLTETAPFVCEHFFDNTPDDYQPGRPGNLGETTFGGEVSLSFWVKIYKKQNRNAVIVDIANAPREHRVSISFKHNTGSLVYRVEEDAGYAATKNGIGDPEVGELPSKVGRDNVANIFVKEEYLSYAGCYSNHSVFGGGPQGVRWWNKAGGNLLSLMDGAVKRNWKYIALANTPNAEASTYADGGSFYFNTLLDNPDLVKSDCSAVPCDSGQGICGCANGGACGTYAVASRRCPALDTPTGPCAMATRSWAVWRRVYPDGPQIPDDGSWHHVGVVHRQDKAAAKMHGTLAVGPAMLFIDHVHTHTSTMILPQRDTRVDSYIGRSNYENDTFEGGVKEFYMWDGAITEPELAAIAKRTMVPTYPDAVLAKAAVQDCGVPEEGYGQCLSYASRMRDPRMCKQPVCECEHNGFRCAVSSWRFNYEQQRQWGESWGAIPLNAGGVQGVTTHRTSHHRCYVDTSTPEGCQCEGDVAFFSFDPMRAHNTLECADVLHAFNGRLAESLPHDVLVPSLGGMVNCPNNI